MTAEEIYRWFQRFRYDPMFRDEKGSHTVPIKCLCQVAGIARQNFYPMLIGEKPLTANVERRLSAVINAVQNGLRWRRNGRVWEVVDKRHLRKIPVFDNEKHRAQL